MGLPHFYQGLKLIKYIPGLVDNHFCLIAVVNEPEHELKTEGEDLLEFYKLSWFRTPILHLIATCFQQIEIRL